MSFTGTSHDGYAFNYNYVGLFSKTFCYDFNWIMHYASY